VTKPLRRGKLWVRLADKLELKAIYAETEYGKHRPSSPIVSEGGGSNQGGYLDERTRRRLGFWLREMYNDFVASPLPERLTALEKRLQSRTHPAE
jgi:hypothetical protein